MPRQVKSGIQGTEYLWSLPTESDTPVLEACNLGHNLYSLSLVNFIFLIINEEECFQCPHYCSFHRINELPQLILILNNAKFYENPGRSSFVNSIHLKLCDDTKASSSKWPRSGKQEIPCSGWQF